MTTNPPSGTKSINYSAAEIHPKTPKSIHLLTLKKSPLKPMNNNCPNCGSSNTKWHLRSSEGGFLTCYDRQSDIYTEPNGFPLAVFPYSPDDESATDADPASSLDSLILSLADLERRVSNSLESLTIEQMDALNASIQTFTRTVRYQLQVTAGQKEIKQS